MTHLEADSYRVGNIIYSQMSAILTTDGSSTSLVAGSGGLDMSRESFGYLNGIGGDAKFDRILCFIQLSPEQVILVDYVNGCLRSVDRSTNMTSDYAGNCIPHSTGPFDYSYDPHNFVPNSILLDVKDPNRLIIAEQGALKSLDVRTKNVSTIWQKQLRGTGISDVIQEESTGNLYVLASRYLGYYNFDSNTLTFVYGGGRYFDIMFLDEHTLIMSGKRVTVLNLETNTTSYICSGITGHENDNLTSCNLVVPIGLLILNNTLYIGEYQRIRSVQGKCSIGVKCWLHLM